MAINSRLRSIINTGLVPGAMNASQVDPIRNITNPTDQFGLAGRFQNIAPTADPVQPFNQPFGPLNDRRRRLDGRDNFNQPGSVFGQSAFGNLNRRF